MGLLDLHNVVPATRMAEYRQAVAQQLASLAPDDLLGRHGIKLVFEIMDGMFQSERTRILDTYIAAIGSPNVEVSRHVELLDGLASKPWITNEQRQSVEDALESAYTNDEVLTLSILKDLQPNTLFESRFISRALGEGFLNKVATFDSAAVDLEIGDSVRTVLTQREPLRLDVYLRLRDRLPTDVGKEVEQRIVKRVADSRSSAEFEVHKFVLNALLSLGLDTLGAGDLDLLAKTLLAPGSDQVPDAPGRAVLAALLRLPDRGRWAEYTTRALEDPATAMAVISAVDADGLDWVLNQPEASQALRKQGINAGRSGDTHGNARRELKGTPI